VGRITDIPDCEAAVFGLGAYFILKELRLDCRSEGGDELGLLEIQRCPEAA
jgi:hypothetical protein